MVLIVGSSISRVFFSCLDKHFICVWYAFCTFEAQNAFAGLAWTKAEPYSNIGSVGWVVYWLGQLYLSGLSYEEWSIIAYIKFPIDIYQFETSVTIGEIPGYRLCVTMLTSILLCDSKTWPSRTDVRRQLVFEHRHSGSIARRRQNLCNDPS